MLYLGHIDSVGSKNLQVNNGGNAGVGGIINYDNTIDTAPLIITSNQDMILETTGTGKNIELKPESTAGSIVLTGTNLERASQSGTAAGFLRIKVNGVFYRMQLLADAD